MPSVCPVKCDILSQKVSWLSSQEGQMVVARHHCHCATCLRVAACHARCETDSSPAQGGRRRACKSLKEGNCAAQDKPIPEDGGWRVTLSLKRFFYEETGWTTAHLEHGQKLIVRTRRQRQAARGATLGDGARALPQFFFGTGVGDRRRRRANTQRNQFFDHLRFKLIRTSTAVCQQHMEEATG